MKRKGGYGNKSLSVYMNLTEAELMAMPTETLTEGDEAYTEIGDKADKAYYWNGFKWIHYFTFKP